MLFGQHSFPWWKHRFYMSYFKWVQWYELLIKTRSTEHICLLIFYANIFKITAILIWWLFTFFAKRFAILYWKLNLAANAQLYLYKPTFLSPLCVLVLKKDSNVQKHVLLFNKFVNTYSFTKLKLRSNRFSYIHTYFFNSFLREFSSPGSVLKCYQVLNHWLRIILLT